MKDKLEIKQDETIVAISTPMGEGGVGMVRMSGVTAVKIAERMFRNPSGGARETFESRRVYYGNIVDVNENRIDEALVTVMFSPKTYTREDVVEITCHGGPVVVKRVLGEALRQGARLANPGEFSKRAFLNGRIDLVQAEAIIDIIRAKSEKGWKTAFSQLDGKLSERLGKIENDLVTIMADLEASIDFPEEELDIASNDAVMAKLHVLTDDIQTLVNAYDIGRIYREGVAVAIVGRPNVGKSSLMNGLLERERVIVTPYPGTTRDTVEETLSIEGVAVKIVDTAGVREADDPVERIGVEKTLDAAREADIVLLIFDGSEPVTQEDMTLIEKLRGIEGHTLIPVVNKSDKQRAWDVEKLTGEAIKISAKTGDGLPELKNRIADEIMKRGESAGDGPVLTRERHLEALRRMSESVHRAMDAIKNGMSREFAAADLSDAKEALEELTGKAVSEQVLEKIFNEFCIGK